MVYQLVTLELVTENNENYEHRDVKDFDNVDAAKLWVNQIILALRSNVEQKCAKRVEALDKWKREKDGTLTRAVYYEESDRYHKYVTWIISEKSIFN